MAGKDLEKNEMVLFIPKNKLITRTLAEESEIGLRLKKANLGFHNHK